MALPVLAQHPTNTTSKHGRGLVRVDKKNMVKAMLIIKIKTE